MAYTILAVISLRYTVNDDDDDDDDDVMTSMNNAI